MNTPEAQVKEAVQAVQEKVGPMVEQTLHRLGSANARGRTFIRAHPAAVLLGALTLGYVFGRVVSR